MFTFLSSSNTKISKKITLNIKSIINNKHFAFAINNKNILNDSYIKPNNNLFLNLHLKKYAKKNNFLSINSKYISYFHLNGKNSFNKDEKYSRENSFNRRHIEKEENINTRQDNYSNHNHEDQIDEDGKYSKNNQINNSRSKNFEYESREISNIFKDKINNKNDLSLRNYTNSKYYQEKNTPETFQSKYQKLDLSVKDPNIKRILKDEQTSLSFKQMGFLQEIYTILDKLEINSPTSIQNIAIPKILEKKNIFFASQTGMGKTLAYILPIINELKLQELQLKQRLTLPKRPRVLILAPSRELCQQIEEVIKLFVYDLPLVVETFYVGKSFGTEKKYSSNGIDILISTPERFKNHWGKNNIFITKISHLVIDELDTFLDSGYADFIMELTEKLLKKDYKKNRENSNQNLKEESELEEIDHNTNHEDKTKIISFNLKNEKNIQISNNNDLVILDQEKKNVQVIFVSTTLTKSIEKFLDKIFQEELQKQRLYSGEANFLKIIDKNTNHNLSNIKHEFLQVTDYDKYPTLLKILRDNQKILKQNYSIILFVNSIVCSRKTEMFLAENGFETSCLHGEIPPLRRRFEMDKFKKRKSKILVTTDLIARGLDFPFVYLVINFDFPNNISDYIHRAGRTGRAGRKGFVISFFRKFNIDLIDDIKKSNQNKTPLLTEGSMYSKFNKEDFKGEKNQRRKRLTHGILNKSINSRINNPNNGERLSVIQKLKMRKEKIDKMKVKMIKEGKERIKTLDSKYNRKFRNTNKNNTYGKRFVKREK